MDREIATPAVIRAPVKNSCRSVSRKSSGIFDDQSCYCSAWFGSGVAITGVSQQEILALLVAQPEAPWERVVLPPG
jgi:hypothetical protein